ncbi:MAG: DoxX family protein [Chryseobacterium sp. 36-9]|nr:MAG: DoxX family protein [Chryseobacterium sp. 36-9]
MINSFFIRFSLVVIMAMHAVPSFISMDVLDFGRVFLAEKGFASFGIPVAILVKLIHLVSIPLLLWNRYLKCISVLNILILVMGIIMIHAQEGWYVVGPGRNGVEYNFLLIFCFLSFVFPKGLYKF